MVRAASATESTLESSPEVEFRLQRRSASAYRRRRCSRRWWAEAWRGLAARAEAGSTRAPTMKAFWPRMPDPPDSGVAVAGSPPIEEPRSRINLHKIVSQTSSPSRAGFRRTVCWHLGPGSRAARTRSRMMELVQGGLPASSATTNVAGARRWDRSETFQLFARRPRRTRCGGARRGRAPMQRSYAFSAVTARGRARPPLETRRTFFFPEERRAGPRAMAVAPCARVTGAHGYDGLEPTTVSAPSSTSQCLVSVTPVLIPWQGSAHP